MAKLVICPHEAPGEDTCEFQVQSENEREVVDFAQQHAEDAHGLSLSQADVEDMIQDVER